MLQYLIILKRVKLESKVIGNRYKTNFNLKNNIIINYHYYFMYRSVFITYMYVYCVNSGHEDQKRTLNHLKLEFKMVVSSHIIIGNPT